MEILKMTMDDYEAVYALWLKTAGIGLTDLDDGREGIEQFLKRNPNTCFVAREGERLVGVILGGNDGRRGALYHAAVEESERGKGIGTALTRACLEALRQEGVPRVTLAAYGHNESGNDYWERRGFVLRDDLMYRTKDLVQMETIKK